MSDTYDRCFVYIVFMLCSVFTVGTVLYAIHDSIAAWFASIVIGFVFAVIVDVKGWLS